MDQDPSFEALLHFLKESRGFDFTGYKRTSLARRVDRRMQQLGVGSYPDYLDYLQVHQEEFTGLFNTILINVTGFFRDPEAWDHLRDVVLPEVLAAPRTRDHIRVWSAGCASGEEAYSMAMLLAELLGREQFRDRVKIYATDIDEDALAQARAAAYSERDVRSVPEDLRERYFEPQGSRFVFAKDLRRSVIFGRNDLVQDAPISHVDLLLCRNTLMYFNAETQMKILGRFHFALNDGGVLFLGKAEMLLSRGDMFGPIDLRRRFFRKAPRALAPALGFAVDPMTPALPAPPQGQEQLALESLVSSPVATVILTPDGAVAASNRRAEDTFGLSARDVGRPFQDLELSYRPAELRGHVDQVRTNCRAVWLQDVEWARGSDTTHFDIQVSPLLGDEGALLGTALYFVDASRYHRLQGELEHANRQLETAYEELQSTAEELETTNEELQSTVEELQTTNEELQSTNEELETMNEELQSANDELQTMNDELRERTRQIDDANAFMESVLRSLRAAVVVVDRDLHVRAWNRRAEDLWGLRPEEAVGQHLLNLDIGLSTDRLRPLVRGVLQDGADTEPVTFDAVNRRGRGIRVRVMCSELQLGAGDRDGVIVLMEEVEPEEAPPAG